MAQALHKPNDADVISDDDRLVALGRYDVLDTPSEPAFDRITTLMRLALQTEVCVVSLIDGHRQWYKSASGTSVTEVPVAESFCKTTIQQSGPVVVPDATNDPRFRDNPHVTGDDHIRAYIATPLTTSDGRNIGTLCAYSRMPRMFTTEHGQIMQELAKVAINELELRQLATTDALTGTMSRRAFKDDAQRYVAHAQRHRTRLSALAFDIDYFKRVNDTYGHAAGDKVLKAVGQAVQRQLRVSDLLGRVGGDEFAVLLPETDLRGAVDVGEKLCAAVRKERFPGSFPPMYVTASFGVAAFNPDCDDLESLLVKADEALYEAKRAGRNRVAAWQGTTTSTTVQVKRRRVLKAGRLIFNDRRSTLDCTVRALWDKGAEVGISTMLSVPDEVVLEIMSDSTATKCAVVGRRPTALELAFV